MTKFYLPHSVARMFIACTDAHTHTQCDVSTSLQVFHLRVYLLFCSAVHLCCGQNVSFMVFHFHIRVKSIPTDGANALSLSRTHTHRHIFEMEFCLVFVLFHFISHVPYICINGSPAVGRVLYPPRCCDCSINQTHGFHLSSPYQANTCVRNQTHKLRIKLNKISIFKCSMIFRVFLPVKNEEHLFSFP